MPFNRISVTDDDGSGTVGTTFDAAFWTAFYDLLDVFARLVSGVVTLTDGATPALDASLGSVFRLAAGGDRTIGVPTNPTAGQKIIIQHFASGGARTLA